jgi:FG-GAP repeat
VNALSTCDLTGDGRDELVIGRDDGTLQVSAHACTYILPVQLPLLVV